MQLAEKRQRRPQLQQQGECPGQRALLAQAEPENPRTLHCPRRCRPVRIQPQRNRQAGENDAQRQAGLPQQRRAAAHQQTGQAHVDHAQHQGTERGCEFQMLDQRELQTETHQRRAEEQRTIDVITLARRPAQQRLAIALLGRVAHLQQRAPGVQQTDGQVHQEEHHQERLGAPQHLGMVGANAPGETDAESADEANDIEHPPGLEPGDGKDAAVEQDKVTEECDMTASSRGHQQRRSKAAQRCGGGQAEGILGNGENRREHRHRHQQAKRRRWVKQRMQAHRGEHRQVQHGDAGALQDQCVTGIAGSQPPTQAE
ncbi:hypothetical protein D3C84_493040 [compost metagenome]